MDNQLKNKRSLINNSVYLYLAHSSDYILSIFLLPFIARVLGVSEFGIISIAQTFGIFISLFMEFGSSLVITREIARIKEKKKEN